MTDERPNRDAGPAAADSSNHDTSANYYARTTLVIQSLMVLGLAVFLWRHDWENVFLTVIVIALALFPAFLSSKYRIFVPAEFQLIAVGFVFLSLFLGSAGDFYYHFWWWDIALHVSSGFLLGIVGWITLFLLNQTDRLPHGIRPAFLCFFGVTFAVFLGVLWETFEFTVDQIWPAVNMQSNETGVVDTMYDLIVDMVGAILVALMGWAYFKWGSYSFIVERVKTFIRKNPRLFPSRKKRRSGLR
jgi:hypothetical protein